MEAMHFINVTEIEPRLKHPTIFNEFDRLAAGESLVIHNDHDPMPLYYQLIAERGNIFTWQYLQKGPEIWEVQITKTDAQAASERIGEIVAKDIRKAEVFRKFGIDFCCGGKKTVEKAAREKGIDASELQRELDYVDLQQTSGTASQNFDSWELDFLADYIVNTHHKYVARVMPDIFQYTQKVARVHGKQHPETVEIAEYFVQVMDELNRHMMKEEKVLFPYIKSLVEAQTGNAPIEVPHFGTVENPVRMMEHEHDQVGEYMRRINELASAYNVPAGACNTYRLSYAKLKEFEEDLHQHIHLENNILFPKAIELEKSLLGEE
jgi:regulator of cell morphogenesis and NO signaling